MGAIFDSYTAEAKLGREITIGDNFPEIMVSDSDEIICYAGMWLEEQDWYERNLFMQPYYLKGQHSDDRRIKGFYRLANGAIFLDRYVDQGYSDTKYYKRISAWIRFPTPDTYYGVLVDRREDETLTRAVFGLTYDEATDLAEAYSKVMGTDNPYRPYPRVTRSVRKMNFCDITGCWIPEQFPYITFNESVCAFSHVSLFGFYRLIQLLTGSKLKSAFSRALIGEGLSENILCSVFKIGESWATGEIIRNQ